MLRLLICDSDAQYSLDISAQVRSISEGMGLESVIYMYSCGEEIPCQHLKCCDIVFLEAAFPNSRIDGMTIARNIRRLGNTAIIIFITNNSDYACEGYEINVFRYILKDQVSYKLKSIAKMAIMQVLQDRPRIQIPQSGESVSILLDDILYIEAQSHTVVFHLVKTTYTKHRKVVCYNKISLLEEQLNNQGFMRIHRSFLINMRHITKLQCDKVTLANGQELNVSEKNYRSLKKKYHAWKELN